MKTKLVPVENLLASIEELTNPVEMILTMYKMLHPDFDKLDKIPLAKASYNTNKKIIDQIMIQTKPLHREGVGMLWVNNGFSTDIRIPDGFVEPGKP